MGKPSTMPGGLPPGLFAFGTSVSPSENTIRQPVAITKLLRHHVCCSNGGKAPARDATKKPKRKERQNGKGQILHDEEMRQMRASARRRADDVDVIRNSR
jgi:hypothetical protein